MIKHLVLFGDHTCSGTSIVKDTLNDILFDFKDIKDSPKSVYLVINSLVNGHFTECIDSYVTSNVRFALSHMVHYPQSVDVTLRDDVNCMIDQLVKRLVYNTLKIDPDTIFVVFTKGDNVLMNGIIDVIKKSISGHLYVADYTWCRPGPYNITVCNTEYFNLSKGN